MSDLARTMGRIADIGEVGVQALRTYRVIEARQNESKYIDYTVEATRRFDEMFRGFQENEEFDRYGSIFDETVEAIRSDVFSQAENPRLAESLDQWLTKNSEQVRQNVSDTAFNRQQTQMIAKLPEKLEEARSYQTREMQELAIQSTVENYVGNGWIDENKGAEILRAEYGRIRLDKATDDLVGVFQNEGYDNAFRWVHFESNLSGDDKRQLDSVLGNLQRRKLAEDARLQENEDLQFWQRFQEGQLTIQDVRRASHLSRSQREHWERRIQEGNSTAGTTGATETTDEGKNLVAQFVHDIDSMSRDRSRINDDINKAHLNGELSWPDARRLLAMKPMEDQLGPVWEIFDSHVQDASVSGADKIRLQRELLERLVSQYYRTDEDGNRVPRREFRTDHLMEAAENFISKKILEESYMKMTHRDSYRLEADENIFNRHNSSEDNLRAIDSGQIRGVVQDYQDVLDEMSYGHLRLFEQLPQIEGAQFRRFDLDGRPLFEAVTPRGPAVVGFFLKDPYTGVEYEDETPYMYSTPLQRWVLLPDGTPVNATGGGGRQEQGVPRSPGETQLRMQ